MKKLKLKEIQKIELDILKYIDELCLKNKIDYTIVGGTALGAIRHNGFIPWDDDIDIGLTPKNYFKILKLLKKQNDSHFRLMDISIEKNYPYPFAKLVDKRTILIEDNRIEINGYGVYVDIFMYHGLPNNKFKRVLYFYILKMYQLCFDYLAQVSIPNSNGLKGLFKKIIKSYAKLVGPEKLIKRHTKLCNKYPIESTTYCTSNWPCVSIKHQILKSEVFFNTIRHEFEDININIMSNYDDYLTNAYGDYMTLPPVEKRKSPHPSDARWKENNENVN